MTDIIRLDAATLGAKIAAKEVSSTEATRACLDQIAVLVSDILQLGINRTPTSSLGDDCRDFHFARRSAQCHLRAVVKQNAQPFYIVDGFTGEQGVRTAGIIPNHSPE